MGFEHMLFKGRVFRAETSHFFMWNEFKYIKNRILNVLSY